MESANGMNQPWLELIIRFFQEDQWSFQRIEQKPVFRAGYRGEHGTWVCYIRIDVEQQKVLFHSLSGLNILPQFRFPVLHYLDLVNQQLSNGRFDVDIDNGDVLFKTTLDLADQDLTVDTIRSMAYENVRTMDRYFPGVVSVVHGGLSPETALARIEMTPVESRL